MWQMFAGAASMFGQLLIVPLLWATGIWQPCFVDHRVGHKEWRGSPKYLPQYINVLFWSSGITNSWDRVALSEVTSKSHMGDEVNWVFLTCPPANLLTMLRSSDCDLLMVNPHSHKLGVMPCDIWTRRDLPILNAFATGKINYVAVIVAIMPAFFSGLFFSSFSAAAFSRPIFVALEQQMAPVHDLFKTLT